MGHRYHRAIRAPVRMLSKPMKGGGFRFWFGRSHRRTRHNAAIASDGAFWIMGVGHPVGKIIDLAAEFPLLNGALRASAPPPDRGAPHKPVVNPGNGSP